MKSALTKSGPTARASATSVPIAASILVATFALLIIGCGEKKTDPVSRGRTIYMTHCIACHSPNPAKDGSLGPALSGSSLELLQARIVRGEYPPGYSPKRSTQIMQKLPLEPADVEALHAFLNAP